MTRRQLSDEDTRKITSVVGQQSDFHNPILHLFAVRDPNAVVIGGRQEHVGDVFCEIGWRKRGDKWIIADPISTHSIVAVGREQ